jgi:nitrogen fixation NifU-like protein
VRKDGRNGRFIEEIRLHSDKAADYYLGKVNVGELSDPDAYAIYTGPCGDTMEFFLKVEDGTIKDASFQAIG